MEAPISETPLTPQEIIKVQNYLRKTFGTQTLRIVARAKKQDSAEVMLGEEFIGIIFKDDEDGETTYHFQMSILEMDLDG